MGSEIIKVLDELCRRFGIVVDWTSENVIPYLQQLCVKFINWEVNTSLAWIIIAGGITVLMLIFSIVVTFFGSWSGEQWFIFLCVLGIATIIIGVQVFDIIECKTFPEKAIYDYIKMYMNN